MKLITIIKYHILHRLIKIVVYRVNQYVVYSHPNLNPKALTKKLTGNNPQRYILIMADSPQLEKTL